MSEHAKRIVFRVRWTERIGRRAWWVFRDREPVMSCPKKQHTIWCAVQRAREMWGSAFTPAQVVIHRKNGTIQEERTYGNDPRRTKG